MDGGLGEHEGDGVGGTRHEVHFDVAADLAEVGVEDFDGFSGLSSKNERSEVCVSRNHIVYKQTPHLFSPS